MSTRVSITMICDNCECEVSKTHEAPTISCATLEVVKKALVKGWLEYPAVGCVPARHYCKDCRPDTEGV